MAAAFLPAAERSGRRDRICASTLRAAYAQSRGWRAAGPLLRAVVDLAHDLDMAEVAAGAGTEGQVARLEGAGCDRARGAFLAAPQPAAGFERLPHRLAPAAPPPRPLASALQEHRPGPAAPAAPAALSSP
ncbi:MAG TPA: hypothetical protein VFG47_07515 [Geminicoccaceae bacterium]|nr:hypothetical protein [Geminicoccaceae bacterium]